ncbi:MAG: tetratricopeptide repeat protein, partial [Methanomassiliicoccaceae archaeon]|nr:tetratricopeptide repeat protein [Methanomassiliicoccaceae archaeon]
LKGNAEYRSADHRSASRSYAKALEIRPHDAKLWHSRGMAEEMAGMYKDAESSYDRAVIMDLDNPSYWLSKAIVQEKRGDLKGSVLSLNRVISESPDNVFALVRKARILAFAGRNEDALFFLDHALKVDGMNIKILEMKKNIYRHAERYEDVIESCKAILRIDKKNIIALTDMAETFQRIGRHDDALKVLDTVSSDLGEVGVLMMKKHSAGLNGNTEVEIESCRSILKIEPNNRNVKLELADALIRNGDHADAMKVYDEVHEEDPRDAEVIVLRGKLRALMADEANTVELYHEAVLDNPDDPDILNKLAATLCDSGEYDEAYGMISRAIEISPDVAEFHMTGARILMAKNDPEGALKMLNSALNDVPDRGEIYLRIGEIHERLKNYDDALTAYDSALREGADANYRKGRVQELKGDREDAKNSYSAAVSSDADNVRALERLGTMQFEDKEYAAARRNLDSALKADPFDTSSLLSRARLYVKEGIAGKAVPIYRTLSSRDDSTDEIRNELNILLAGYEGPPAAEHTIEKTAEKPDTEKETADIRERVTEKDAADMGSTYDLALAALERAYETGSAISDDDMLAGLGITGDKKDMVLDYLSGIEEYGTIDVSSEEFERMERLSKNVILAECIDDIDSNPLVGIPAAFMASTAETIDDAKKLIAYIYKAVTDDSVPVVFSDEVREYAKEASEMSGDISTYTLMKMFNVGVYTAGTIAKLAKRSKKGADIHI